MWGIIGNKDEQEVWVTKVGRILGTERHRLVEVDLRSVFCGVLVPAPNS